MYDITFYLEKYECTLMSLFYLEIIDHTLLFSFIKNGCYISRWLICKLTRPPQLFLTTTLVILFFSLNKRGKKKRRLNNKGCGRKTMPFCSITKSVQKGIGNWFCTPIFKYLSFCIFFFWINNLRNCGSGALLIKF